MEYMIIRDKAPLVTINYENYAQINEMGPHT